jgi:hypothetical protein
MSAHSYETWRAEDMPLPGEFALDLPMDTASTADVEFGGIDRQQRQQR